MNIEKLWKEKKWLFFVALPIVILVVIVRLYEKFQIYQAEKTIKKAEIKNEQLYDKVVKNNIKKEEKKVKIKEIKKRIKERKTNSVPLDWHKNVNMDEIDK